MFHFPAYPPRERGAGPCRPAGSPIRKSSDQSPAGGSPRHIAASNVLHRYCLPRHPPYALASNPHDPSGNGGKPQAHGKNSAGNTNHHTNDHTQNDQTPDSEESGEINSRRHPQKGVPCSRPLSSSQTTTHPHASPPTPPGDGRPARGTEHQPRQTARGGGPGTQKHARTTPGRTARPARPKADSTLPHQQPPHTRHIRGKGAHTGHQTVA